MIAGQKTLLARDVHDIRYDSIHDEIFVMNPRALAVLVFRGGANGEEPPIRTIQGPHTQLVGSPGGSLLDRLDVDAIHNEIFVPAGGSLLVFSREANGNVAPIRTIRGSETQLTVVRSVAVDPVHNRLVVGNDFDYHEAVGDGMISARLAQPPGRGGLRIFNRTDKGNIRPVGVIEGPKSGIIRISQMQVYAPKGWIIATLPGRVEEDEPVGAAVGVWSINDNGDIPPRWKIGGPKSTLKKPRGVALDPKHKELIVSDHRLNAVLIYYFPEIF